MKKFQVILGICLVALITVGCNNTAASSTSSVSASATPSDEQDWTALSFVAALDEICQNNNINATFVDPSEKDDSFPDIGEYHHRGYSVAEGVTLITYSDKETDDLMGMLIIEHLNTAALYDTSDVSAYLMGVITAAFDDDPQSILDELGLAEPLTSSRIKTVNGSQGTFELTYNQQQGLLFLELILDQ